MRGAVQSSARRMNASLLAARWLAPERCPGWPARPASNRQPPPQPQPPRRPHASRPGQQPDARSSRRFRTGINFVRVDVIVTDGKGNPVLDLKPEDFSVSEDGKPQKVEPFSVVKIDDDAGRGPPPRRSAATSTRSAKRARPDVRLFVILLDDYHVRRGNDMAVRKPLIDFIQNQLGPADMVAVMYPLTPVDDIQFSRDRDALIWAIETVRGTQVRLHAAEHVRGAYAYYPAADRRAASATRSRWAR